MSNIGFRANGFIIIDLVPDNELQTGKAIEDNLIDFIIEEKSELYCERYKCGNASELIAELNKIKQRLVDKGEISYIHIEGHGSKETVRLPDGSFIKWSTVFELFREINILCKNNLFFSSGACQSAYAFNAATITEACPVFGLLAPEQKVSAGSVQDGFIAFYRSLIKNESLNDAFDAFSEKTDSKLYALIFSQLLFEKAARKYIEDYCMGTGRRQRIENMLSEVVERKIGLPLKSARKLLKNN
jgi:hypothetical protein